MSQRAYTRAALLPSLLITVVASQLCWVRGTAGVPELDSTAAYDPVWQRIVAMDTVNNDVWEFDGTRWLFVTRINQPSTADLAWDGTRLLVFGSGGQHRVWNGTSVSALTPAQTPTTFQRVGLAFDQFRSELVLFGGFTTTELAETWKWNGTTWTQATGAGPTARADVGMAYDSVRRRVVMFGGRVGTTNLDETWEWNGTSWSQKTPTTKPPARSGRTLAWDDVRQKIILFGGRGGTSPFGLNDTWEWDGTNWVQLSPATVPMARDQARLVTHVGRGEIHVIGDPESNSLGWRWNGSDWVFEEPLNGPVPRRGGGFACRRDDSRCVYTSGFGGNERLVDSWELTPGTWTPQPVPGPGLALTAMTWDDRRQVGVLFGGYDATRSLSGQTWEYDVSGWRQVMPTMSPPARTTEVMAFDTWRGRTVMFGGYSAGNAVDDTWEYDGATWTEVMPATRPPARQYAAMSFDEDRHVMVLFGGQSATLGRLNDTWEYDGTSWVQRMPVTTPVPRDRATLTYDSARKRMVLVGGWSNGSGVADSWEWDGTNWSQGPNTPTWLGAESSAAYDCQRRRVLYVAADVSDVYELAPCDGGVFDAGPGFSCVPPQPVDAGVMSDAGTDAGVVVDAGIDAGTVSDDAGVIETDAGQLDVDAGVPEPRQSYSVSCSQSGVMSPVLAWVALLLTRRWRSSGGLRDRGSRSLRTRPSPTRAPRVL